MHAIDFITRPTVKETVINHRLSPGATFFGRLKNDQNRTIKSTAFNEMSGSAQQHGGVTIMAASMHFAWNL